MENSGHVYKCSNMGISIKRIGPESDPLMGHGRRRQRILNITYPGI